MLALSPKTALLIPARSAEEWHPLMDDSLADSSENRLLMLRRRRSRGGRPWATPSITTQQQRARKLPPQQKHIDPTVGTLIRLHGDIGFHAQGVIRQIITHTQTILQRPLRPLEGGQYPTPDTWSALMDPLGEPNGDIIIHLPSTSDISTLTTQLHGKAFQLGPTVVTITIQDDAKELQRIRTKNGRRDPRHRGGAAASTTR